MNVPFLIVDCCKFCEIFFGFFPSFFVFVVVVVFAVVSFVSFLIYNSHFSYAARMHVENVINFFNICDCNEELRTLVRLKN